MRSPLDRQRSAKLFEYVVAVLLHRNGYRAGVPLKYLQGRGTKHQVDVLAVDPLPMPFVFPTRILCEAKCYSDEGEPAIGVKYVRNLFAEVTDLQQTLPRQRRMSLEPVHAEPLSCVYAGAIFSTIPFSRPATEFANSYAISLVPLPRELQSKHLPALAGKLEDFVGSRPSGPGGGVPGCPHDCFAHLPFDPAKVHAVLDQAGRDILRLGDPESRRLFVFALDAVLSRCPKLTDMNQCIQMHRVAAIGNQLVLARIAEDDFRTLAKNLARRFLERGDGGFSNLATPSTPPENDNVIGFGPVRAELGHHDLDERPPRGFELFTIHALGASLKLLALSGTVQSLNGSRSPHFSMALDFGLTLHARI